MKIGMKRMKYRKYRKTKFGIEAAEKNALKWKEDILEGQVLSIDPSCISSSSLPGWAIFEKGKLKESGVIEGPAHKPLITRLQYLAACVGRDFETPDVLVIEKVSSSRTLNVASTMEARGVFIAMLHKCEKVIELDPHAWRYYVTIKYGSSQYYTDNLKSDTQDAIEMGECAVWLAKGRETTDEPK